MIWANTKPTSSEEVDGIRWSEWMPMLKDWSHTFAEDGMPQPQTHITNEKTQQILRLRTTRPGGEKLRECLRAMRQNRAEFGEAVDGQQNAERDGRGGRLLRGANASKIRREEQQ